MRELRPGEINMFLKGTRESGDGILRQVRESPSSFHDTLITTSHFLKVLATGWEARRQEHLSFLMSGFCLKMLDQWVCHGWQTGREVMHLLSPKQYIWPLFTNALSQLLSEKQNQRAWDSRNFKCSHWPWTAFVLWNPKKGSDAQIKRPDPEHSSLDCKYRFSPRYPQALSLAGT